MPLSLDGGVHCKSIFDDRTLIKRYSNIQHGWVGKVIEMSDGLDDVLPS